MPDIFEKRIPYKPFEYPICDQFSEAIEDTFWVAKEVNFDADVHHFHTELDENEKYIIGTILKTFAQTEVFVADEFWGVIANYLPKPEIAQMAATFTQNEWRHAKAYDKLSEVLGLSDYQTFLQDRIAVQRFENLTSIQIDRLGKPDKHDVARTLALFGCFTEYVNLFSQFAILKSFSSNGRNLLSNIANIIDWSQKDEAVHALAAMMLFNKIIEENPELWNDEFKAQIYKAAGVTFDIEINLLNQIFKFGDLPNLKKDDLIMFMKDRINKALNFIGLKNIYEINLTSLKALNWFYDDSLSLEHTDFFAKRPTAYTKYQAIYNSESVMITRDEMEILK